MSPAAGVGLPGDAIETQRATIAAQQRAPSGDIVRTSMVPEAVDPKQEEVIKDILWLKTYDGKLIRVNLPEVWRRLDAWFSK